MAENLPLMIDNFNGKNRVVCAFREAARIIAEKNRLPANVHNILFVIDETTEKQAKTATDIFRVPPIWVDVLFQLTLRRFDFVIKITNVNIQNISSKTFKALIYHELKHIKKNHTTGELYLDKSHDIEDWRELLPYGDWEHENNSELPDFFTERKEFY